MTRHLLSIALQYNKIPTEKKASLGIPKRTYFLWDTPVEVKNMPQGMFYFSVLWSQLIIPYTGSCFYISLLILNNYKCSRISHLHAVIIKIMSFFPQLLSISKKMQLAPHKYSYLINFSMRSKRKKKSNLCIQWHLYKGWCNCCFSSSVCLAVQNRLSKTAEALPELIQSVSSLPFICIHKICQLRLN